MAAPQSIANRFLITRSRPVHASPRCWRRSIAARRARRGGSRCRPTLILLSRCGAIMRRLSGELLASVSELALCIDEFLAGNAEAVVQLRKFLVPCGHALR